MGVVGWSIGNGWCTLLIPVMFANIQEVTPSEHVSLRSCHGTDYGCSIERHVCLWHREHYRHHRRLGLLPGDCEPDAGGYVPLAFPLRSRLILPFGLQKSTSSSSASHPSSGTARRSTSATSTSFTPRRTRTRSRARSSRRSRARVPKSQRSLSPRVPPYHISEPIIITLCRLLQ